MPASQAGRRGFDPRLPLHLFNSLGGSRELSLLRCYVSHKSGSEYYLQPTHGSLNCCKLLPTSSSGLACSPFCEPPRVCPGTGSRHIHSRLHPQCCPSERIECEGQWQPALIAWRMFGNDLKRRYSRLAFLSFGTCSVAIRCLLERPENDFSPMVQSRSSGSLATVDDGRRAHL